MKWLHLAAVAFVFGAVTVTSNAHAAEFPSDHTIVVSDDWCAPNNDGHCNTCNLGHLIRGAHCSGSYCDNMIYQCANPPYIGGEQTLMMNGQFPTDVTDGFDGSSSTYALCPNGTAMVGMYATGPYSANVFAMCQAVYRSNWDAYTLYQAQYGAISDEAPLNNTVYASYWLSGASCSGTDCDNMFYWYQVIM